MTDKGPLTWTIADVEGETVVTFSGMLDERSNLAALPPLLGAVTFDLAQVSRVTSGGVTLWIRFIEELAVTQLSFARCSIPVVNQMNMVRGFRGRAVVRSFFAPYLCQETDEELQVLLRPEEISPTGTAPVRESTQGTLTLADLPARYFAFILRDGHRA